jgi:hypothetical protein
VIAKWKDRIYELVGRFTLPSFETYPLRTLISKSFMCLIDWCLTLYYNNKQLTRRAKWTVLVGSDALVRLLHQIFLTEFSNRNGRRAITEYNIHVCVHSRLLSKENICYGLGANFDKSL